MGFGSGFFKKKKMKNNLSVPIAIVIAGLIIGAALYFGSNNKSDTGSNPADNQNNLANTPQQTSGPGEISEKDHVLGNPGADLSMFVYSDLQCPYCRNFHATLKQIIEDYVKNSKVKIIFRHFPLSMMHPDAEKFAEATECAAELGGETKFWDYMDKLIELDSSDTSKVAEVLGLDKTNFENCLNSAKYADKIKGNLEDGINAGVQGTPTSIIVDKKGGKYPIFGALPYLSTDPSLYQALDEAQRKILCTEENKNCGIKIAIDKLLSQ